MSGALTFEKYPQQPHGGKLVNQVVAPEEKADAMARARTLPSIRIDLEAVITVEMIATGVLSPNRGFMKQADYKSVLISGRLADGTVWPVPLSFAPFGRRNSEIIARLAVGDEVALIDVNNDPVAILTIEDLFEYDKSERAQQLFGTTDRSHPGVDSIFERMGDISLGGSLLLLQRADWGPFEKLRQAPEDTWRLFYEEKKFSSVAGFITGANPLHRGHEYIHKNALEGIDGLFIQPLVEMAKREYVRNEYRMLAYRSVLETYYPQARTILTPLRVTYIFAGPREAILHALIMKNYGCTHALIGRDHAGIANFYDKYASHSIFDEYPSEELGIDVRLFHEVFYCARCANHATEQSCPHDERYRLRISGTGIREMLRHGMLPPKEVVRPEAARIAVQGVQPKGVNVDGHATMPVGEVVKSMFPYYLDRTRLGGAPRTEPLTVDELTPRDLKLACLDARATAQQIYGDVHREYCNLGDHHPALQAPWVVEARQTLKKHQEMVISDLQEKVTAASEEVSDLYMYQNREEAERELAAARALLTEVPRAPGEGGLDNRIWNAMPYERYLAKTDDE